ncbi:hypothetical protein QFY12_004245 [Vibrio vulnificus]|nr:hypothetical protein [Vibrio vulnificus]
MNSVEDYLREYDDEVAILSQSYFVWKLLNQHIQSNPKLLKVLNENSSTWSVILHSLQVTTFMSLGRIFDTDGDAFSITRLISYCAENVEQFKKTELEKRLVQRWKGEGFPAMYSNLVRDAYEPEPKDFLRLKADKEVHRKAYLSTFQPIRHKIMAHKDFNHIGSVSELMSQATYEELEEIISYCNKLKRVISIQYTDGKKIQLPQGRFFDAHDLVAMTEVERLAKQLEKYA